MPLSMFADPSVAIEPPPQAQDFDVSEWAKLQAALSDPFGAGGQDLMFSDDNTSGSTTPAPTPDNGWLNVFGDVGKTFAKEIADVIGGKATAAAARTSLATQQKSSDQTVFWIVGGVGVAVVLGALLLRKKGKR